MTYNFFDYIQKKRSLENAVSAMYFIIIFVLLSLLLSYRYIRRFLLTHLAKKRYRKDKESFMIILRIMKTYIKLDDLQKLPLNMEKIDDLFERLYICLYLDEYQEFLRWVESEVLKNTWSSTGFLTETYIQ